MPAQDAPLDQPREEVGKPARDGVQDDGEDDDIDGWWKEYDSSSRGRFRPILFLAGSTIEMYTWTEARRVLQPLGAEAWSYELALKHGMRDGLVCPVGGRWAIGFWSQRDLCGVLPSPTRTALFAAATFAALRLEQIVATDPEVIGPCARLTPRELAVLRLLSSGSSIREAAAALSLSEETIRTHIKKALAKLAVRNRTEAVAEALRQRLIP